MDTIQGAREILADAESRLRQLMMTSLKDKRYADVAVVAGMADSVAQLLTGGLSLRPKSAGDTPAQTVVQSNKERKAVRPTRRRSKKAGGYPHFALDGNRLVKIAWSKKNREKYEHRASREAVAAFVRHLVGHVGEGEIFDMEGMLPVLDERGGEIPAYQLYLTLAWLRHTGAVEKKGRDGYVLRDRSLGNGGLDKLWSSTPARKA